MGTPNVVPHGQIRHEQPVLCSDICTVRLVCAYGAYEVIATMLDCL